ncbi:retrovirus-related Pol polyprotein from transposon TNT 1-94 [Trichonephila clavipes]|nr:retrovirus-related Pol polyprotein from transposon TNT 1-94 [Trichonephila clavipes]
MDKIIIPDLNGTNYFIWELKMKAALSSKRLDSLILNEKPEDLTRKDEMDWITKNSNAIAYIKLSLADEQALQFAAEDNAKVLWDKIRATYIGEGEDRKIDAASHREEKLCDNIWILDSGASCHMAKESVWFKNISPAVMDIYLADKKSKMMSQGTGNVSAKTVSTKHCNSINLTITDVSYVPQLRCNLLSVTCLMDKGCEIENETWDIDSFFEVSPERNEINQNTENGVLYNFDINNGPGAIENDNSIPLQTTSSPRTGRIQIPVLQLNDVQNQIPVRRS